MKILASVLFDESHANAWSIRPGMPERMNPANPGDASYQQAAQWANEFSDIVVETDKSKTAGVPSGCA